MEDVEFSYRISKKGILLYNPYATVYHDWAPSGRLKNKELFKMDVINHHYVFKKIVQERKIDWIFFWWSSIGLLLVSLVNALKYKDIGPIKGTLSGFFETQS